MKSFHVITDFNIFSGMVVMRNLIYPQML